MICSQTKCQYHISHGPLAAIMCPECSECGAESNIINNDSCVNCWNCISDDGFLRSGLSKLAKTLIQKIKNKIENKSLDSPTITIEVIKK